MNDKVKELGGNVLILPTSAGEVGTFTVVQDPQNGIFSMIEFKGPAGAPPGY